MTAILTQKQQDIVDGAVSFLRSGKEELTISGLAGTGKTTTLIQMVAALIAEGRKVAVAAPTGKAAFVINSKANGLFQAETIHRTLTQEPYSKLAKIHTELDTIENSLGSREPTEEERSRLTELYKILDKESKRDHLRFSPKDNEKINFDTIVFDEASMIGRKKIYEPFIAPLHGVKKIFVGDSAQLPPVQDDPAIDLANADFHLTEILRQSNSGGIIPLSHHITKHGAFLDKAQLMEYGDIKLVNTTTLSAIPGHEDHQIVVWRNKTRHAFSNYMRLARGFDYTKRPRHEQHLPMVGESLMVDASNPNVRVTRGQILKVLNVYSTSHNPYLCNIDAEDENGAARSLIICTTDLAYERELVATRGSDSDKRSRRDAERMGIPVMFPYAITCHKAQGSEWNKVLVIDEMGHTNDDWRKWAYTAVTRARSQLTLASPSLF